MKKLLSIALCLGLVTPAVAADLNSDWPQWRGPSASGSAATSHPPTTWSESENIKWKVDVPGVGSSTPIVIDDRVYVATAVKTDRVQGGANAEATTTADARERSSAENAPGRDTQPGGIRRGGRPGGDRPEGGRRPGGRRGGGRGGSGGSAAPTHLYDFAVIAYDRATGDEIWNTTLTSQVPHEAGHNTNTFASFSPVSDGERLYVSFGSRGVYALDFHGKKLWSKDLGKMQTRNGFGEGSSAAVHDGSVVVPFDHEGESFIAALDATTGEEQWRQPRDERTTWATPLITEYQGRTQVITNGSNRVRSYDLATGDVIWECGGQAGNPIPTPVRFEDNVIVMTGYRGYAIYSIPLSATGDITDTDVPTWVEEDAAPYVSSPVLYKGQLYFVKANNGLLVSRDAKTGDLRIRPTRLPGVSTVYASPVAAADHIYLTGRDGTTLVFNHGDSLDVVATNKLDEEIDASAAIVGDELFLRGKQHLYCISK
ncbi:PQQ-binding-like beta-propeller repeat protein [Allorhodopirellula solitaria]|uniref:Outer membrane biogenesis protein BamB n=1 Tax=Allorhodopirellula solitaria TaxID=2527987 RepID=A0A5C5YFF2_9BACT|nr:PQQ-binding-like beta-propeller repeat protein [Allorhodopirellula solitaria]TWT74020.1 outer membrane biogenesis protein BamB [Allorhodopirellula solitaria]